MTIEYFSIICIGCDYNVSVLTHKESFPNIGLVTSIINVMTLPRNDTNCTRAIGFYIVDCITMRGSHINL